MRSLLSFLLITLVFAVSPALAQKRSITEKDLFNFVWIADPQVAPDGSRVAFVRVTVNEKKDGYNTAIWTVSTANGFSEEARRVITASVTGASRDTLADESLLKEHIRVELKRFIQKRTGGRPVIMPVILQV